MNGASALLDAIIRSSDVFCRKTSEFMHNSAINSKYIYIYINDLLLFNILGAYPWRTAQNAQATQLLVH